jgi:hypothetical protein
MEVTKMDCPTCGTKMNEIEKYGIEIDTCPSCRGVWLDGGELDKIIERVGKEEKYEEQRFKKKDEKRHKKCFLGDLFDLG